MAEVKNIATRDSYGNALKELAAEKAMVTHLLTAQKTSRSLLFLTQTFRRQQKQEFSKKNIPKSISTAALQRQTWYALRQDFRQWVLFRLHQVLPCLRQAELLSR